MSRSDEHGQIDMASEVKVVTKIVKSTKARGFKNLKVGTRFKTYINLKVTTGASNGNYALMIELRNLDTDERTGFSQIELTRFLNLIEFQDYEWWKAANNK